MSSLSLMAKNRIKEQLDVNAITLERINSGSSNLMDIIHCEKGDFVLRRPPKGMKNKSAHNMHREFVFLREISKDFHLAPKPFDCLNEEESYLLLELKPGVAPKRSMKDVWNSKKRCSTISRQLIEVQRDIYNLDLSDKDFNPYGKSASTYRSRQLRGWLNRYEKSKTPLSPGFKQLRHYLEDQFPGECKKTSLIHGDYKFDNLLFDFESDEVRAVLDWELCSIGCPQFDLGASMAYWIEEDDPWFLKKMAPMPTFVPGMLKRRQIYEINEFDCHEMQYSFLFGIFRLAVIASQIFYRYYYGQNRNKRFRHYILGIHALQYFANQKLKELR